MNALMENGRLVNPYDATERPTLDSSDLLGNRDRNLNKMKTKTPIADAASKRALERLEACKSSDDFKDAIKVIISDFIATAKHLEIALINSRGDNSMDEALNSGDGTYKP